MKEVTSSILHILQWGIRKLTDNGLDNPRLDAEVLLAHTLSLDRVALYRNPESLLGSDAIQGYAALLERRVKREPVAYITGYKEFRSLNFTLTRDVLIPRPETEVLLDEVLRACAFLSSKKDHLRILELGTGSGILAVSIAKELGSCSILATDISSKKIDPPVISNDRIASKPLPSNYEDVFVNQNLKTKKAKRFQPDWIYP